MLRSEADADPDAGLTALIRAYKDPHALYDAARRRDGIRFDPAGKCWLVTDHAAVRRILGDPRFGSELGAGGATPGGRASFVQDAIRRQVIFTDGERHRRVQHVILRETAGKMQEMQQSIRGTALRLAEAARVRGELDLVQDFALPFSLETISMVVGVPVGDPQLAERLAQWSTTYANVTSGYLMVRTQEIVLLGDYFRGLVAARRGAPSDDLIGAFLRENTFDDEDDLVINCMMAFAAGRVTTQKLLGDGIPLLLPEWDRWREANRRNPGFARRLTEELLRVVTPTRYLARYAAEDVDLSGEFPGDHHVRRGDRVILFLEAANRDPRTFEDPHGLAPDRQPNPQIAFGFGPHRCPGAGIARVEIQAALEALLNTLVEIRPHPTAPPAWDPNPNLGGFTSYRCLCA